MLPEIPMENTNQSAHIGKLVGGLQWISLHVRWAGAEYPPSIYNHQPNTWPLFSQTVIYQDFKNTEIKKI